MSLSFVSPALVAPVVSRPESLVAALREARLARETRRADDHFTALAQALEKTIRQLCLGYAGDRRRSYEELRQECLLVLDRSADTYTARVAVRTGFNAFFARNVRKVLAIGYHRAKAPYSGVGVRLMKKVAALVRAAREAGVDVEEAQSVLDFAVARGARAKIVVRYLPLIAGVVSLDAPVGDDGSACLVDFLAETPDDAPAYSAEMMRAAAARVAELPETQRRVLLRLYGLDGRPATTLAEIAREERRDVASIAERRDRALRRLRAAVSPVYAGEYGLCA